MFASSRSGPGQEQRSRSADFGSNLRQESRQNWHMTNPDKAPPPGYRRWKTANWAVLKGHQRGTEGTQERVTRE